MASLTPCGMPSRGDVGLARRGEAALLLQQADDFAQEERVSLGLRVDRIEKARRDLGSRGQADELRDIVAREPGEREHAGDGLSTEGDERSASADCRGRVPCRGTAATTRMRVSASSRARNCSRIRDGVSAAWRSSSTSTSGSLTAARLRNAAVESKRRKRAVSGSRERDGAGTPATRSRTSGTSSATSAAPLPSSAASSSGSQVRTYARIDWHHGQ